ncbi:MAG TPA: glycosyltransferase [Clostridia bacterium]|nr:glycosyltransferase [Clostridia bacterium]
MVSVVIPALNEEDTVSGIVSLLVTIDLLDEVIVVCDGCTDNTAQVARDAGATVIELPENVGKGGAMMVGVRAASNDVVLFLDADLIGLTREYVINLVTPVLQGKADMTVGIFEKGRVATDFAQTVAPFLSGQRAVRRSMLEGMSDLDASRFGVEIALTRYAVENNLTVQEIVLKDMTHRMKEEKLGLIKGVAARMRMYWEIAQYMARHPR